ncbi:LCP family protein [Nocardioides sp. GXQ0305]|uniref:LCP family protein n=1 Tax=Nocardioides sp. GXQ0305 TaxID=3423912 RepID=UPI003D7E278B
MPSQLPGPAPDAPAGSTRRPPDERAARVRFRRAVALMVMTLVVPGSAQLVAGNRDVGRLAMRIWAVLLATGTACLGLSILWHPFAFWAASNTLLLGVLRVGLMALAVGWALLIVDAWRLGQPLGLSLPHRRAAVGVNGLLCFSVVGTLLFGAHVVGVQRDFLVTMFGDGEAAGAADGRFNVLLLGGDAGAGRWGLRPDSLTVASIDATTGKTVLISLPRNMANFPFREGSVMDRQFPDGFDCEGCYLNGVSTWAGDHAELFRHSDQPGVDATVSAVEGITDLDISYWAMVNLEGFKDLVDAFGGVTLNVRDQIPVGLPTDSYFRYIEPGTQRLDGLETLWFARARYGSDDYSRMARQKCVMNAMLQQVSPQVALKNFSRIARASSEMVSTSIPRSEVDRFVQLALLAKDQKISTLSLVPPTVDTADPDMDLVHDKVAEAIDRAEGDAPTSSGGSDKGKKRKQAPAMTGGSIGSMSEGYAANESSDLGTAC